MKISLWVIIWYPRNAIDVGRWSVREVILYSYYLLNHTSDASADASADADAHVDTPLKAANPFMRMRNRCITYAVCIYVTFSTFNELNVFTAVQRRWQVNLII